MQDVVVKKPWTRKVEQITNDFTDLVSILDRYHARESLITQIDKEIQRVTSSAESVYNIIFGEGLRLVGSEYGHIMQMRRGEMTIIASNDREKVGEHYPEGKGLVSRAIKNDEIINLLDPFKDPSYHPIHEGIRSEIVIPMKDRSGAKVLGVLNIERTKPALFDEEEVDHCRLLAGQVALAIEQVKLWNGIDLISRFNAALLSGESLYQTYKNLLDGILEILDFEFGQIILLDVTGKKLSVVADSSKNDYVNLILDIESAISGQLILNGQVTPLLINDMENSEYKKHYWGSVLEHGLMARSELIVPLVHNKEVVGVINIEDTRKGAFTEFDVRIISILSNNLAAAIAAGAAQFRKSLKTLAERRGFVLAQLGIAAVDYTHRLGNHISGVKGDLNYMLGIVENEAKSIPAIGNIEGSAYIRERINILESAEKILNDIKEDFNPDKINSEEKEIKIIHEVKRLLEDEYKAQMDAFKFEYNSTDVDEIVCLLSVQFKEVMKALLNNAFESMKGRDGLVEVTAGYKKNDLLKAEIRIRDQGEGILKENKEKIFNFGFTTKKHKKGQGLGMWLVKYYVEYFGGEIVVDSIEDIGTEIIITFPIKFFQNPLI